MPIVSHRNEWQKSCPDLACWVEALASVGEGLRPLQLMVTVTCARSYESVGSRLSVDDSTPARTVLVDVAVWRAWSGRRSPKHAANRRRPPANAAPSSGNLFSGEQFGDGREGRAIAA